MITIDNKDEIYELLNSDLRIYNGGRIENNSQSFELRIHFDVRDVHVYHIDKESVFARDTDNDRKEYKVLDDQNELFDYLSSLYGE
ncbi:hypothetical protein [Halalkalibacillus halophilus]|uniref:hypothetical protein n=1 Tax=Halalkalibacillus halophilus TaxID=392827 RepID=UPI0012EC759D|nr:hypothetical protein [Halalkalibacillus halophilus]